MSQVRIRRSSLLLATVALAILLSSPRPSAQVTYEVIGDLTSLGGTTPLGGLIQGPDGAFYGATLNGNLNCGIIYRFTTDGALTLLHTLITADGCTPVGELAAGPDGALYGVTQTGGELVGGGAGGGTVYRITTEGAFTRLHAFSSTPPDSSGPYASLTLLPDGWLYGTTSGGDNHGTAYRISTEGVFEKLYDGNYMQAALTLGSDGNLYGTFFSTLNAGGIFGITTWGEQVFGYAFPWAGPPSGCPCPEGMRPLGELVEGPDGSFYGTTSLEGPNPGDQGTVFRISLDGTLTTLHAFSPDPGTENYSQGSNPFAGLTLGSDGNLYGVAYGGGAISNGGIYRLSVTGDFEWLHSFDGTYSGASGEARLLEVSPGIFYGVTAGGGVFKLTTGTNVAPVATDGSTSTSEDTPVDDVLEATDANGNALTFSIVANGSLGAATITDAATGAFTYTPNGNANGSDSFTFRANDGVADSNVATVTVTISAVNDAPVALNGSASTFISTAVTGTLLATDVDGPGKTFGIVTNGTKGTATVTDAATGAYSYTPAAGQSGVDTFTFGVNDSLADSNVATITVNIAPNQPPTAANGAITTNEDRSVSGTLSAADADGNPLVFSIVSGGTLGTVTVTNSATGQFKFKPHLNANGEDSFSFQVSDGSAVSNTATVSVTITPVNDAPGAQNGAVSTTVNTAVAGVLAATDPDSGDVITFALKGAPKRGTVTVAANGSFTYKPRAGFVGTDAFTFTASDGSATSGKATITITVQ